MAVKWKFLLHLNAKTFILLFLRCTRHWYVPTVDRYKRPLNENFFWPSIIFYTILIIVEQMNNLIVVYFIIRSCCYCCVVVTTMVLEFKRPTQVITGRIELAIQHKNKKKIHCPRMNNNRLSNDARIHLDVELTVSGNDKCNYST